MCSPAQNVRWEGSDLLKANQQGLKGNIGNPLTPPRSDQSPSLLRWLRQLRPMHSRAMGSPRAARSWLYGPPLAGRLSGILPSLPPSHPPSQPPSLPPSLPVSPDSGSLLRGYKCQRQQATLEDWLRVFYLKPGSPREHWSLAETNVERVPAARLKGGAPCAVPALCEKSAVFHHR